MGSQGLISPKSLSSDGDEVISSPYGGQQPSAQQAPPEKPPAASTSALHGHGHPSVGLTAPQQGVVRTVSSTMRAEIAERLAKLRRQGSGRSATPAQASTATDSIEPRTTVPAPLAQGSGYLVNSCQKVQVEPGPARSEAPLPQRQASASSLASTSSWAPPKPLAELSTSHLMQLCRTTQELVAAEPPPPVLPSSNSRHKAGHLGYAQRPTRTASQRRQAAAAAAAASRISADPDSAAPERLTTSALRLRDQQQQQQQRSTRPSSAQPLAAARQGSHPHAPQHGRSSSGYGFAAAPSRGRAAQRADVSTLRRAASADSRAGGIGPQEYCPSVHSMTSTVMAAPIRHGEALYRREVEARARNQARYARLKLEEEEDTLRSCTFRPATQPQPQRLGMARSRSLGLGRQEVASMRLYQQALEQARSHEAKRLQEQQENLEDMRAATPRAQRLSEKVYGRHANERVDLLRAALRSPLCQPSMLPAGPEFTFHPTTNPRRHLTCPEAPPARLRRAQSVPRMGTLASALTEAAASVGVPLAEATPKVHAELDFGDFLARQAAFVQGKDAKVQIELAMPKHTFAPALSLRTRRIMQERGLRDPAASPLRQARALARLQEQSAQHTFKPRISPLSESMPARGPQQLSLGDQHRHLQTLEALRTSLLDTEALTATFQPRTCRTAGASSRLDASQNLPPGTGLERLRAACQDRLREKLQAEQELDAAACTFTPRTRTLPSFIQKLAAARADAQMDRKVEGGPISARYFSTLTS